MNQYIIYVIVVLVVFFSSISVFHAHSGHLFALLISGLIIYYLHIQETQSTLNFNEEMEYKYNRIGSPSHLYKDADLINIFYAIINWQSLNDSNFLEATKAANNVLIIKEEIMRDSSACENQYSTAVQHAKLCLNYIHSYIYVLEHPLLVTKLKDILGRLAEILEQHLNEIKAFCKVNYKLPLTIDFIGREKEYDPSHQPNQFHFY